MTEDIRWQQRFQNYQKAFVLLREPLLGNWEELSDLEKQGVIQRFEIAFELAWKTLGDYLAFSGAPPEQFTPRTIIKQAFAAGILPDGQTWIDILEHRNLLSHRYDEAVFAAAVREIAARYLAAFERLSVFFRDMAGR